MCGIAGYIVKQSEIKDDNYRIKKMTDAIRHRGPDDEGQWVRGKVALGHRRLAIIDLDRRSRQPFISNDGRYVITYNGEIYNYQEIKEELLKAGISFRTTSDTEVIIEAYKKYGTECFNMFNGMWAFCIYDIEMNELVFCRDRFGVKPLYILDRMDVFAFASEAKGILAGFPEENIPSKIALYRYLSGSVNEDRDETSYYENIKIFPQASYMIYDLKTDKKKTEKYWQVDEKLFYQKWIKGKNPYRTFRLLFENAVGLRLHADVEVGACLSGGIDSSAIVGVASGKYGKHIQTFSSVYKDENCNEEEYAREANRMWHTGAHYIMPDDEESNFVEYIKRIDYHHDGPAMGASLYSQYMVMKGVYGHVKVLLDGQGSDEMFAGYIPYYSYYISDLMCKGGFLSRIKAVNILSIVMEEWPEIIGAISTDTVVELVGLNNSFQFMSKRVDEGEKARRDMRLFTENFDKSVHDNFNYCSVKCSSNLNTCLCNDVLSKSIPALLHNEDANSMAFSIESRVPFLDYRLVEFAMALDERYKLHGQWTKWIVRKSLSKYLPQTIMKRKGKMGFPAPFSRWIREGKSKDEIKSIIFSFAKRNIVPLETIQYYYDKHCSGEADLSIILFKFFSAEIWLRSCETI